MSVPYEAALLAGQRSDGGWAAAGAGPSMAETTAWAVAALHTGSDTGDAVRAGIAWLARNRLPDGGWAAGPGLGRSDAATAPVVLVLARLGAEPGAVHAGAQWLLGQEAPVYGWALRTLRRLLRRSDPADLDESLRGWSWTPGDMTWVEPTALALLALRAAPGHASVGQACAEGEALLLDRACPGGGWNYGNGKVFHLPLPAYPDTTAWALLALHDRRAHPAVRAGQDWLRPAATAAGSGLALSLAALVAQRYGAHDDELLVQARDAFARTAFCGDTRALALALLAERRQGTTLFG